MFAFSLTLTNESTFTTFASCGPIFTDLFDGLLLIYLGILSYTGIINVKFEFVLFVFA